MSSTNNYISIVEELASDRMTPRTIPAAINRAVVLMDSLCHRVANRHRNYARLTWDADRDDLYQIVRTVEAEMLKKIAAGTPMAREWVHNWEAAVFVRARSAITQYADSGAVTQVSGYTSAARRQRSLAKFRTELEIAGTPPDDDALLAEYNRYVTHSRSNPKRQGAFAVKADLAQPIRFLSTDTASPPADPVQDPTSTVDSTIDMIDLIQEVLRACHSESLVLHRVAVHWLGWFPDGGEPSVQDIAKASDISVSTARRYISRVIEITAAQLTERGCGPQVDTAADFRPEA